MWNVPTPERLDEIPKLYETENIPLREKLVYLHFFIGNCDWYVCEFDREDTFWGFVILNGDLLNAEWGYISFSELMGVTVGEIFEIDCELSEYWSVRPALQIHRIAAANNW